MRLTGIPAHRAGRLEDDLNLFLVPVWVLLGMMGLTLHGAGVGVAAVLTGMGALQLVFGVWVFWTHGGRQITAAGVYSMSSAIFVGFAAIYYAQLYGSAVPRVLHLAMVLCYFSHVAMYVLFWRTSYPVEQAARSSPATTQVTGWLAMTGLVLMGTAVAAQLAGIEIVIISSMAFVSVVLLVCASFRHPGGLAGGFWYLVAAVIGFGLYSVIFFSGYGRLNLATLCIVFAAAACRSFRHRWVKLITLVALPGALLIFGAIRQAFFRGLYPEYDDTANNGFESVMEPFLTFGQIIDGIGAGTIDYGYGSTFVATLFLEVPRAWWEGKPIGFGAVLVQALLEKGTYAEGASLSALTQGEWFFNFGVAGIVAMVVVLGPVIRWLDRVLQRVVTRPLRTRSDSLALAATLVAVVGMSDLMWVGTFTYNERAGTRLLVILAVAVLCTDVFWRRVRALSRR